MSLNKLILIFVLTFFYAAPNIAQHQSKVKARLYVKLKSVEKFRKSLKSTTNYIYSDGKIIDSVFCKKKSMVYTLDAGHLYKVEFSKTGYVSKHIIINTKEIPVNSRKKIKLKADINLFTVKDGINVDFLKYEPVSIAYYNFITKTLIWDYDYNRSVVEKIIHASIEK